MAVTCFAEADLAYIFIVAMAYYIFELGAINNLYLIFSRSSFNQDQLFENPLTSNYFLVFISNDRVFFPGLFGTGVVSAID